MPRRLAAITFAGLALWAALATPAQARERRHLGAQLRVGVGPGLLHAFQDLGEGQDDEIDGVSASFNVVIGSMIAEDTSLGMDLSFARAGDADHGVLESTVFSAVLLGVGVTHWLMPANVYLAASLGAARSSVEGSEIRFGELEVADSDPSRVGPGLSLSIGKLWWVGTRWGLGASLSLLATTAANPVGEADTNRHLVGAALQLTATYR